MGSREADRLWCFIGRPVATNHAVLMSARPVLMRQHPCKRWTLVRNAAQISILQQSLPHDEKQNTHHAFLLSRLSITQFRWSLLEKEGSALIATVMRLYWLTATPHWFHIITEDNSLDFVFDPLYLFFNLCLPYVMKTHWWQLHWAPTTTLGFTFVELTMFGLRYWEDGPPVPNQLFPLFTLYCHSSPQLTANLNGLRRQSCSGLKLS